jgi:hypothetical protein
MTENPDNFSEHKIYKGIYNIFEWELEKIGDFVAFSDGNMEVYSNKIHELHLRVCSEIENILKIIIHQHFMSKQEVEEHWKDKKTDFLKDKDLVSAYEELKGKLASKKEREKLDKLLYGFPDFSFYFKIACKKFNLDKKIVKFKAMISQSSNWNDIQPFKSEEDVPLWWTHYNNLKHDKIKKYEICTLRDLISSMSGLFVLINYLVQYRRNNSPIPNSSYIYAFPNEVSPHMNADFCSFKSKLFEASVSHQMSELSMVFPQYIKPSYYENVEMSFFYNNSNINCHELFKDKKLKEIDLISSEYISPNQDYLSSIFYIYVDYYKVLNFHRAGFWKLGHFGIFSN